MEQKTYYYSFGAVCRLAVDGFPTFLPKTCNVIVNVLYVQLPCFVHAGGEHEAVSPCHFHFNLQVFDKVVTLLVDSQNL